jgi:hypothetical protein
VYEFIMHRKENSVPSEKDSAELGEDSEDGEY